MPIADPLDSVTFYDEKDLKEPDPLSTSDPLKYISTRDETGKVEFPLNPKESFAATALDTLPYGKYLLPEEQQKFSFLSDSEKTAALAIGALGTALFFGGGPLLRGVSRGISAATGAVGRGLFPNVGANMLGKRLAEKAAVPVEDLLSGIASKTKTYELEPFSYETALRNTLQGTLKFKREEVDAITAAQATGNSRYLTDAVIERSYQGKGMSKAWQANVTPAKELYGGYKINDEVAQGLTPEALLSKHRAKQYSNILEREVLNTRKFPKQFFQNTYEQQMRAIDPEASEAALKLENITEKDFANFVTDMLDNKRAYRSGLSTTGGRLWPASLTPTRVIYGLNETSWKATSNFYKPLKEAYEAAKTDSFDWARTWNDMLHQRGLGKIAFDEYGGSKLTNVKFTKADQDLAYGVLKELDAVSGNQMLSPAARNQRIIDSLGGIDIGSPAGQLIDAFRDFSDTLYGHYMANKLPQILRKEGGLSIFGQNGLDATMAKYTPRIMETFSSSGSRPAVQKITEMKTYLNDIKALLQPTKDMNGNLTHPWFELQGKDLTNHIDKLTKELTLSNDGGKLTGYTDNYVARISADQDRIFQKWSQALTNKRGFFEQRRFAIEPVGEAVDFNTMLTSRVMAQSNALYFHPAVDNLVSNVASKFPTNLAAYAEHHIARLMNMPSNVDYTLSRWFENSIGRVESLFGREGTWSPRRVMNLSQTVNDLVYLGALGFKPFSAARNLFQPLITGAPDIGEGGYASLLKGYTRMVNPATRDATKQYLNEIGVISEYLPEISSKPQFLPFTKTKLFGREMDTTRVNAFTDSAMWMFKASDRFNKYVTGAAAMNKWETGFAKFADQAINANNVGAVLKATGANNRNPWVKTEIEDLLRRGLVDDAKKVYVKDVVGDSQFLYGAMDAPQIIGRGGSIGKTGLAFQSYWMNLAPLIEKSLRTGDIDDRIRRPLMGILSSAIAYQMMEPLWGKQAAKSSVGAGPFPTDINEFMIPAAWSPIYRALRVGAAGLEADPEMASKQAKKLLGSTLIFVPGGLQAKKMFKGARDEGFTGFAKSIVGLKTE